MDAMSGPVEIQEELLPEKLERIRRLWMYKVMAYIYEMFFHDHTVEEIYRERNDTALLAAVSWLTIVILILLALKVHAYIKYKQCILTQIKIVNAKWQSMQVSIDILKKIIQFHGSIVTSQIRIEQLKQKQSDLDTEQSGVTLASSSEYQQKPFVEKKRQSKPIFIKRNQCVNYMPNENDNLITSKTRKVLDPVFNQENVGDETLIKPDPRKSKTRYTMQSAKSRSQPNLTLLHSGEDRVDVDAALAKLSSSEIELEELHSRALKRKLFDSVSSINICPSLDLASLEENSFSRMPLIKAEYLASDIYGDIAVCSNQILEFLKDFELASGRIPLEKHVEITGLIDILLCRIFGELDNIKEDLAQF